MMQRESTIQVISCLGDAILVPSCRIGNQVIVPQLIWRLVMEAIVSSTTKYIALICCILCTPVVTKFGESRCCSLMSLKVEVWRSGRLVVEDQSFVPIFVFCGLRGMDQSQVYFVYMEDGAWYSAISTVWQHG